MEIKELDDPLALIELFINEKGKLFKHLGIKEYDAIHQLMINGREARCAHQLSAYLDGELIASSFYFRTDSSILFLKGAVNEKGKAIGAMVALHNHVLESHCESHDYFDFGGSDDKGLREFNLKFGAIDVNYLLLSSNRIPWPLKSWVDKNTILMHKRILLTGSSGGLGLIMAQFLLREGHFVYLHCHANPSALESLCLAFPNQTKLLKANLLIEDELTVLFEETEGVNVLIHAAGVASAGMSWKVSKDEFRRVNGINYEAPFFVSQLMIPELRKQKWGRIIFSLLLLLKQGLQEHQFILPLKVRFLD